VFSRRHYGRRQPDCNRVCTVLRAGTTTLKNAYADKDKGSSFTKLALDADSRGVAYGDGVYKLKFYAGDPDDGGTDTGITIDNYKCTAVMGAIRTVTSADDIDRDDELVLVDTTSGNITVTLADVDTFDNPVTIKKIAAGNTVTIATTDSQTNAIFTDPIHSA
jgi:hypothetical protein